MIRVTTMNKNPDIYRCGHCGQESFESGGIKHLDNCDFFVDNELIRVRKAEKAIDDAWENYE